MTQNLVIARGEQAALAIQSEKAHSLRMSLFKCPNCQAEYDMVRSPLSFRQRSYAKCQVCHKTMYSWDSKNVPQFTFIKAADAKARTS